MNNINIKNIFNNELNNIETQSNFNIINIVKTNTMNQVTDEFIINKIKINKSIETEKTIDLYNVKYKECLIKINNAIDINITDIFFKIPKNYFGYKNYNSKKCLEFIQEKLRKKNFETLIYSDIDIFISWKNVNS
jgi:hypothetical protein